MNPTDSMRRNDRELCERHDELAAMLEGCDHPNPAVAEEDKSREPEPEEEDDKPWPIHETSLYNRIARAELPPGDLFIDDELPPETPGSGKLLVSFWRDTDDDSGRATWVWQVRYPNGHCSKYTATIGQLIQALKDASGNPDRGLSVEVLRQGKTADEQQRQDLADDPGDDGGIGAELARRKLDTEIRHEQRADEEVEMQDEQTDCGGAAP